MVLRPERRTAGKGALCAAKRTLDGEHRSGTDHELGWAAQGEHVPAGEPGALRADSSADDSQGANATIDHSDIRGSEPHGHDPSGAASD